MTIQTYESIVCTFHPQWVELWLNRPQARNAMSFQMVDELIHAFENFGDDVQAVIIRGKDGHFCAGGDVKDMRTLFMQAQQQEKIDDAAVREDSLAQANRKFGTLLSLIQQAPQVVITVVEGSVMGGGFGLACVSDIAVSLPSARFALPEVSLGITPAQIAPFVVKRIGLTHTRYLALTAQRFKPDQALAYGLVHTLCDHEDELQTFLTHTLQNISRCAPQARRACKALLFAVEQNDLDQVLDQAASGFSHALREGEGIAGIMAFMSKKPAAWQKAWGDLSEITFTKE